MTGDDLEATIFAFLADYEGDDLTHRLVLSDVLLWVRRREQKVVKGSFGTRVELDEDEGQCEAEH